MTKYAFFRLTALFLTVFALSFTAFAQVDVPRRTTSITYPLDETVVVQFRGTTRFPRMKGEARIKRTSRNGTEIELSVSKMPRPFELGRGFATYVLWAVSPDGTRIVYSYFDRNAARVEAKMRDVEGDLAQPLSFLPERWAEWSRDGRSIYYSSTEDGGRNVWRYDLGATAPVQLTRFTSESPFDCSWSPDGARAACVRQVVTSDAVMIRF